MPVCSNKFIMLAYKGSKRLADDTLYALFRSNQRVKKVILSVTIHIYLQRCTIKVVYLKTLSISRHLPLSGYNYVAFLNDAANDAEWTQK